MATETVKTAVCWSHSERSLQLLVRSCCSEKDKGVLQRWWRTNSGKWHCEECSSDWVTEEDSRYPSPKTRILRKNQGFH